MYKIIKAQFLAQDIKLFRIEAPKIAKKRLAGQFVIIRVDEFGERIPLTIADSNTGEGSITIIVQGIGKTTRQSEYARIGGYHKRCRWAAWYAVTH